jgi:small-conductance mechanosensitive channel
MSKGRLVLVGAAAGVLAVCLVASYLTRGAMENRAFQDGEGAGLVDQRPWQTAAALAPQAVTAEERALALQAERLADHEVDQAFAMALRQAVAEPRALTGHALELQTKLDDLGELVNEDQDRVDGLTGMLADATKHGGAAAPALSDDLDVAKSQLQLDSDEMGDVSDDLARERGDSRVQIQQELTAREETMKKYDAQMSVGEVAVVSVHRYGTLAERVGGWFSERSRTSALEQAKADTDADIAALTAQHTQLEQSSNAINQKLQAPGATAKDKTAGLSRLHGLAQLHSILDDRISTEQELSSVYGKWVAQVGVQRGILDHLILGSLAGLSALLLGAVLVWWVVQMLLDRLTTTSSVAMDMRSVHTLRTVASLAIQLVTVALALLVVFGVPSQMPTVLGLGAAGLTVVFQDFILAFFGWFVLMGRNGIRVGDWVEINGVGGEVVEIGLFRTALLETGNWTDNGHPTGRRVTFINNFAVTGQFFNFSTAGQWMWDEISVNVPSGEGTYKTIEAIHTAVLEQTEKDAKLAEEEWKHATKLRGLGQFSATPSVDMRPAASGIDILVRYVTRAQDRFEMRNKLYQTVIELLHKPEGATVEVPEK